MAPADFVVVTGALRTIPESPSRVRWVSLGGVGLVLDMAFLRLGRRVALEEIQP